METTLNTSGFLAGQDHRRFPQNFQANDGTYLTYVKQDNSCFQIFPDVMQGSLITAQLMQYH
jgi:hypothetical protein